MPNSSHNIGRFSKYLLFRFIFASNLLLSSDSVDLSWAIRVVSPGAFLPHRSNMCTVVDPQRPTARLIVPRSGIYRLCARLPAESRNCSSLERADDSTRGCGKIIAFEYNVVTSEHRIERIQACKCLVVLCLDRGYIRSHLHIRLERSPRLLLQLARLHFCPCPFTYLSPHSLWTRNSLTSLQFQRQA